MGGREDRRGSLRRKGEMDRVFLLFHNGERGWLWDMEAVIGVLC